MKSEIDFTVITPMFNEEACIRRNLELLVKELKRLEGDWELIVVNDGSTDNTLEIVSKIEQEEPQLKLISYRENRGRGYALRQGFKIARGRYIITTESDLSWGAGIIQELYNALIETGADVMIASPYLKGGRLENIPLKRAFLSRFGNKLLTFSVPGNLTMLSGMTRGYKKEVIESLELESDRKEIHLEIIAKCTALGYKILEIPAILRWEQQDEYKPRKSKFHARKVIFSHLAFSFYQKPMMLFGVMGFLMVLGGFAIGVMFAVQFINRTLYPTRPIYLLMVILLIAGIQMLSFGFISNQIGNIKKEIFRLQRRAGKKRLDREEL